jgi:hypothetical protein
MSSRVTRVGLLREGANNRRPFLERAKTAEDQPPQMGRAGQALAATAVRLQIVPDSILSDSDPGPPGADVTTALEPGATARSRPSVPRQPSPTRL